MSDLQAKSLTTAEPVGDDRWSLVLRMASSRHFAKAPQLRQLLLYTSKLAITAPGSDLSEQEIGHHVLGRRPDYNTQEDNIVRVQIRHVRQRLDEYFVNEGKDEPLIISIPRGSHLPRFDRRSYPAVQDPRNPSGARGLLMILLVLAVGIAAFSVSRISGRSARTTDLEQRDLARHPIWSQLFLRDQDATIVVADTCLVMMQNILGADISLDDYTTRGYPQNLLDLAPNPTLKAALVEISSRQYTSLADAIISSKLSRIAAELGSRPVVRYSRNLQIRDLDRGNFVLVGSRRGIPWVELFEPHLNFLFERHGDQHGFLNRHPLEHEAEFYPRSGPANGPNETYATVALVPNLTNSGQVLLLNGATMESMEAAADFITRRAFPETFTNIFGGESHSWRSFEILFKTKAIAGAPTSVEVIAWRKFAS